MNSTVTGFQVIDLSDVAYKDNATFFQGLYDRVKAVTDDKKNFIVKVVNKKTYMISQADVSVAANAVTIYFPVNRNMQQLVFQVYNTDYYTFKYESGEAGVSDYEDLSNLPKINNVELKGNKSLSDLGISAPNAFAFRYNFTYDTTQYSGVYPSVEALEGNTDFKDFEDNAVVGSGVIVNPMFSVTDGVDTYNGQTSISGTVMVKNSSVIVIGFGSNEFYIRANIAEYPYSIKVWFEQLEIDLTNGTTSIVVNFGAKSVDVSAEAISYYPSVGSETIVGQWSDGKPIYRTVVNVTGSDFHDDMTAMALATDVDTLVSATAKVSRSDGAHLMNAYYNSATDYLTMLVDHTSSGVVNGYCKIQNAQSLTLSGFSAILEYTKVTP